MKTLFVNRLLFVISIVTSFIYSIANSLEYVVGQFYTLIFLFVIVLLYSLLNKGKTLVLLFFLISFFTFLISRDFFVLLLRGIVVEVEYLSMFENVYFSYKISALFLSLLFLFWGHYYSKERFRVEKQFIINNKIISIKKISLLLFYFTCIFKVLYIFVNGQNVMTNSYANIDSTSNLPHFVVLISFLNSVSFMFYINSYPVKKELLRPLILFVILTLFSIVLGERGSVIYTLFFILIYLIHRDSIRQSIDECFLGKKFWLIISLLAPFILITLNLYAFVRSSEDIKSEGFLMDVIGFFLQQGGSSNLICLVEEYKNSLPETNLSYTFGPIINFFNELFHTNENIGWDSFTFAALFENNLGATLTYITNPGYYYSGGGLGTQYTAELMADFGYIGIVIYNFMLGILLRFVSFDVKKGVLGQVFCSFIIISLMALPRDFCFSWFISLISPAYLISICFIYLIGVTYYRRYSNIKISIGNIVLFS